MSFIHTILYNNPANFVSSTGAQVTVSGASCAIVSNPNQTFTQGFLSGTGFTYDSSKAEFVGGVLRKKDWRPAGYSFIAALHTIIDGNWGGGVTTGTAVGGAAISGGWLDCTGGTDKYVRYAALGNISAATQTGTYKTMYKTGTGSTQGEIFAITKTGSAKNLVSLTRLGTGTFKIQIYSNTAIPIVTYTTPVLSTSPGDIKELEFFWDLDVGYTGLRVDGILLGIIQTATGTRDTDVDYLKIGGYYIISTCNAYFKDVECWPTVQHHADYTPGYTVYETIYLESKVDLPAMPYPGIGLIQSYTSLAVTEVGTPHYLANGKYWTGSAWATSDNSYAQSNTLATINSNLATLSATASTVMSIVFMTSNTLASVDDLILTYIGQIYSTTNPSVIETTEFLSNSITAMTQLPDPPYSGSDLVKYVLNINAIDKYWDGSAWSTSTGYAQSNTMADINTNIAALDISAGAAVKLKIYLHSATGLTTPLLTQNTLAYSFVGGFPTSIPTCAIWGYTRDEAGVIAPNITVSATLKTSVELLGAVILKGTISVVSNTAGYWEIELPQTLTYDFKFVDTNNNTLYKETGLVIPALASQNYDNL